MHKIKNIVLIQLVTLFLVMAPVALRVSAAPTPTDTGAPSTSPTTLSAKDCPSGKLDPSDKSKCMPEIGNGCANDKPTAANEQKCLANNSVITYLKIIINTLSAGVGVVVTAMIIWGGIQYTVARDNAAAVTEAKKRIMNAIIALVLYMLIFAFLQWLIPGGVFGP